MKGASMAGEWLSREEFATFLDSCPGEMCDQIIALREFIRRTAPQVGELIRFKSLWYVKPEAGGTIKGAVCAIGVRGDEVHVAFVHGAFLADPEGILQPSGRYKRHVALGARTRIPKSALSKLIRAAIAHSPTA